MSALINGLRASASLLARYRTLEMPDEAYFVATQFERDLVNFARQLAHYDGSDLSERICGPLLGDTGLRLVRISDELQPEVSLPFAGAVVSGNLSITYFIPRRRPGASQCPVLAKSISEGSSFYISNEADCTISAAPGTRLVICDQKQQAPSRHIRIERSGRVGGCSSLSNLSDAELLDQIDTLDFKNVSDLVATAAPLLAEIGSRRDLLRKLFSSVSMNPVLRNDCELLNEFYKYVLHRSKNDFRLRLHLFRPDAEVSPHAHRWSMVSHVLSGPCASKYYGVERDLEASQHARQQKPQITHRLQAGSCYAFADTLVHWFLGAPGSATLTLRGPAMKDRAAEFRPNGLMRKYGIESNAEPSLRMTQDQFDYGIKSLELSNVL